MSNSVYDIITQKVIDTMQQGIVPWRQPWIGGKPKNLVSKKEYTGVNVWLLACHKYKSAYWLSYKQAQELGGQVRKGEHGQMVVFWKPLAVEKEKNNGEKKTETIPLLRYYTVFNTDQCDGINEKIPVSGLRKNFQPIEQCEAVTSGMPNKPVIKHEEPMAYYHPRGDYVNMPSRECFNREEFYYSVLFHELGHATGHESRLKRKEQGDWSPFGSDKYSKEELVAEMTAAFLCGHCQIEQQTIENTTAYIQSWVRRFKEQSKMVVLAAAQAQKAADYILGVSNG